MKKGVIIALGVGVIVLAVIGGFIIYNGNENIVSSECKIKNPDPDGYLLKICEYLKQHEDTIIPNKNPNEYSIKGFDPEEQYGGKAILVIRLDCCGTGDLAYIDKESKEVIGFSPGDY